MSRPSSLIEIIWSDENFIAVAKPAGLAAIPGRGESTSVLDELALLLNLPCAGSADPRLRVVHRIDKDTSGVLLFAKNRPAQQHVSHQFQNSLVAKEYLAIVAGVPNEAAGQIDAPIARHPTSSRRMAVVKSGRPAKTNWQLAERFRGMSLLRIWPKTGKTHQIRVHLLSIGLPLLIDPLYNPAGIAQLMLSSFKRGYRDKNETERPLIARLTLHANILRFKNLQSNEVEIVAEPPKDFRAAINMLRKYAR